MIQQYVGRIALDGYGVTTFECDGQAHAWAIELFGEDGKFAGGKATVFVSAVVCNVIDCAFDQVQQTIRLRR